MRLILECTNLSGRSAVDVKMVGGVWVVLVGLASRKLERNGPSTDSVALAGAAATITSDALMNPFDGKSYPSKQDSVLIPCASHQATNANPQFTSSHRHVVRQISLSCGRIDGFLRLLSDHHHHDGPIYRGPVLSIRIFKRCHQPRRRIQSDDACNGWRYRWRYRRRRHHPS